MLEIGPERHSLIRPHLRYSDKIESSQRRMTHSIKASRKGGVVMRKQISALLLIILLSSTLNFHDQSDNYSEDAKVILTPEINRIEISPDPNSIRDLGRPLISEGKEGTRDPRADSSIGIFSDDGLLLSKSVPGQLLEPRKDLMIVVIESQTGLWDARMQILEVSEVAIRSTIPPSGFIVQGSVNELLKTRELPFIQSSHSVPIAMIIDDRLWDPETHEYIEMIGWKDDELFRIDSPGLGLPGSLSDTAEEYMDDLWSPSEGINFGTLDSYLIPEIAHREEVAFLTPVPQFTTWNNLAGSHMELGSVEDYFFTGLNGSDQRVAVADTGIDHDHGDFGTRIVGRVDVANDQSTADTNDGHGTHVACTVLGSGSRSSGTYQGIAPEAELYMQAMEDDDSGALTGPGVYTLLNSAYSTGGARIHTNSWGSYNSGGQYSTQSEDADDRTSTWDQYWTYDGMTVLFAAGNERDDGVSPPGTAKNVITVGAHVNRYSSNPSDEMYYWSSRGPTDDGRIKPDIVAAGDYVRSCKAQEASEAPDNLNDQWYVEYSGTSMATPAAAGASAIVREYLMEIAERPEPQGALVKAMLILGAEDMGTRDIPNNDEGWGRLNLVNSLLPDNQVGDVGIFVDDRSRLSSGQEASYNFDVTRSGEPLKVVLAWSDYPGSAFSSTQLRNDLNLEVTSPEGTVTYLGNDFSNGRSSTGGGADSKNNVEVVLIDSASTGIWNVKVKDYSHGGSRSNQPFAIAVRGVNVNDLTPDPTFVPESFEISTLIPQVGEQTTFSVSIINQGSGSLSDLFVSAHINNNLLETKSLSMTPGQEVQLEWSWTPETSDKGLTQIRIEIDPSDQFDELYEDNNLLVEEIEVSAPGIQPSTETQWVTLEDATATTASWEILMTNLALFDTNASIQISNPVRISDGEEQTWFRSFDRIYVELGPAESTTVNLTLVHPASPQPGTYSMTITAIDEDFDVESQLEILFDVPVLGKPDLILPSETIWVDSFDSTNTTVNLFNRGNGAQTYDIELFPPAGWDVGLIELGPFLGSRQGSSGTLEKDDSISVGIAVSPPGVLLQAGTIFEASIHVTSRVGSEVWTFPLPLEIKPIDSAEFSPSSGNSLGDVAADSQKEIDIQISNQGNRVLNLTPIVRSLPGGWSVYGGLDRAVVPIGSSVSWSFEIQGNGLAASGPVEIRFLVDGGAFFDWNATLDAVSGAKPSVSFAEVVIVDGTSIESSNSPLGLGAHPVGRSFDMGWEIGNDGSSIWEPSVSMEAPSQEWLTDCSINPARISPGGLSKVWCTITIPLSEPAGSEPIVTLMMEGDGLEVRETISLLVDTVMEVEWTLTNYNEAFEDLASVLYFELTNTGNTPISNRIVTEGPSGWIIRVLDGFMVTLQPGEVRSVQVEFTPNSGSDGELIIMLGDAEYISGYSKSVEVEVEATSSGSGITTPILVIGSLVLILGSVIAALAYYRKEGDIRTVFDSLRGDRSGGPKGSETIPQSTSDQSINPEGKSKPESTSAQLQTFSEYPGWLWDPVEEEWIADPNLNNQGDPDEVQSNQ